MTGLGALLSHRLASALLTVSSTAAWLQAGGLVLLLAALTALFGRRSGFLRWRPVRAPWTARVGIALACLFTPALAEELAFRALLIPGPGEQASFNSRISWSIASLTAFVLYHPLKSRLLPARRNAPFAHPVFLALTTLLGAACTVSYVLSGSLWPPVVIHWLCVTVWLLWLDGWEKMGRDA